MDDTPTAFIGVRACELAAIAIQDKVFCGDGYRERHYAARREKLFLVAVDCSQAAATCFCHSSDDGPAVGDGADIVLTEILTTNGPRYLVRSATDRGKKMTAAIGGTEASDAEISLAHAAVDNGWCQPALPIPGEQVAVNTAL